MPDSYDLFVSYAHSDDDNGWVTAFVDALQARHRAVALRDLDVFLDHEAIPAMSRWEDRIQQALKSSKIMLAILSPAYFASEYCRREWQEFAGYQELRPAGGDSIAPIYIATAQAYEGTISAHGGETSKAPGETSAYRHAHRHPAANAEDRWLADLCARQNVDVREWFGDSLPAPGGPQSVFQRADVQARLDRLDQDIEAQLQRQARALAGPSTVPPHNPNFVGRREELRALRTALATAKNGAVAVIQGLAGMGKSALAFEYAHAYADDYVGGRFLVPCAHVSDVRAPLVAMAELFGVQLSSDERKDLGLAYRRLRLALESGERRLLVFDNVDDPQMLSAAARAEWPGGSAGTYGAALQTANTGSCGVHALVTTRLDSSKLAGFGSPSTGLGSPSTGLAVQSLDALSDDEAVDLLIRGREHTDAPIAGDEELAAAESVARRLGGYPLALETVGVYLAQYPEVTVASYDEWLAEERLAALDATLEDDAVQLSGLERRRSQDQQSVMSELLTPTLALLTPAQRLAIEHAAYLAPDFVPLPWLQALTGRQYPELLAKARPGRPDPWRQVVRRLTGLRLLTMTDVPETAQINRLTAEVIRALLGDEGAARREATLDYVVERTGWLNENWPQPTATWEAWPAMALASELFATARERAQIGSADSPSSPETPDSPVDDAVLNAIAHGADIANQAGWVLMQMDQLEPAHKLVGDALAAQLAIGDGQTQLPFPGERARIHRLAESYNQLALIQQSLGRLETGRDAIVGGPADGDRPAGAAPELGARELYMQALRLLERLLADEKRVGATQLAPEASAAAPSNDNPPNSLTNDARKESTELGIAAVRNNLASLEQDLGHVGLARELFEQVLEAMRQVPDISEQHIAYALNNLAGVEYDLGRLEGDSERPGALELYQQTLEIRERLLPPDHPLIALSCGNLANVERDLDRLNGHPGAPRSLELYRRALDICAKSLPPDHQTVANVDVNYAQALGLRADSAAGDLAAARSAAEQGLAIFEKALPADHPLIANARSVLGEIEGFNDDLDAAEASLTQAVDVLQRKLGPEHTWTLTARAHLAAVRYAQGETDPERRQQGLEGARAVYAIGCRQFGKEHFRTKRVAAWLAQHDRGQ